MIIRHISRLVTCASLLAMALLAAPAAAQMAAAAGPPRLQTALASDAGTLSDKFAGLAKVMAGKYDWKPGQGVRSVSDVFNLIVTENKMLTGLLTGAGAPGGGMGGRGNQVTDPAEMQEALRSGYRIATTGREAGHARARRSLRRGLGQFGHGIPCSLHRLRGRSGQPCAAPYCIATIAPAHTLAMRITAAAER